MKNLSFHQSTMNLNVSDVFTCTDIYFDVLLPQKMKTTVFLELVNNTSTLELLCNRSRVVFEVNQDFFDPYLYLTKALFTTH